MSFRELREIEALESTACDESPNSQHSVHMRIHTNASNAAKRNIFNYVSHLWANTGKLHHLLCRWWDVTIVLRDDYFRHLFDELGLVIVKTNFSNKTVQGGVISVIDIFHC